VVYLGVVPTVLAFGTWAYALSRMDGYRFERLFRACFRVLSRYAVNQQWYGDVLHCVQSRQEVEELKHEADRKAAKACTISLIHALQVVAEHLALAGILVQDRRNDGDQCRFSTPGRAGQHEQLAAADVKINATQRHDARIASSVRLGQSTAANREAVIRLRHIDCVFHDFVLSPVEECIGWKRLPPVWRCYPNEQRLAP